MLQNLFQQQFYTNAFFSFPHESDVLFLINISVFSGLSYVTNEKVEKSQSEQKKTTISKHHHM